MSFTKDWGYSQN